MKKLTPIFLSLLSPALLALSFPKANLEPLAFVGLVPLFWVIYLEKSIKKVIIFSYLSGTVFFYLIAYWLVHVSGWLLVLTLYGGFYFLLFGYALKKFFNLPKKNDVVFVLFVSAFWVSLEFVRNYILTGLSGGFLGYSQFLTLPLVQIADIGGVYLVSFFVVAVNAGIFILIRERFSKPKDFFNTSKALILVLMLAVFTIVYGFFRLNEKIDGPKVKLSVLQGNIPLKWYWESAPEFKKLILDRYVALTKDAAKDSPELIVWPETSVPGFIEDDKYIHDTIKELSKEVNVSLLIGSPTVTLGTYAEKIYNSVILQKQGREIERYNKLHLVPFGEYIPLETNLYFIRQLVPRPIGDYSPGDKYTIFPLKEGVDFGVVICFEDVFPNLVNRFIRNGADFMINITNDEWFLESSAPYQHAQASVLRAVENRINMVRSANTGVSCFIDPKGRITTKVADKNGKDIFVEGYKTAEIIVSKNKSFYALFGDIFAIFCLLFSLGFFIKLFILRRIIEK